MLEVKNRIEKKDSFLVDEALAMILDNILKLNLMPRNGHGQVLLQIKDYKITNAEIQKETIKF